MVVRIGPERFAVLSPEVPSHVVKGLGNALRHGYDGIDRQRVFDTIATSIPVLRAVMLARAVGHE
jgi:uncharacterized protein with HEPN domain